MTAQRIQLCYGLYIPTVSALRKYVLLVVLQYFIALVVETIFSYQNFLVFYSVKNMDYLMTNFVLCQFRTSREYGELLVSCGLVGEALKIFEDLELWDNLIYCYQYVIVFIYILIFCAFVYVIGLIKL